MKYYLKELLILIYVIVGSKEYYNRITELGFSLKTLAFIGLLLVCILGIVLISYIQNNKLRIFYAIMIFCSSVVYLAYGKITYNFLTYDAFITLIYSRGFLLEATEQFASQVFISILISLLLLAAISIKPNTIHKSFRRLSNLSPVFIVFLLMVAFFMRGGDGAKGLHSPFIPFAYAGLALYEAAEGNIGERKNVQMKLEGKVNNYDIVLIIDESISSSYLDINSKHGVLTNLINAKGINIFNLGHAAAISHCSHTSNLALRFGGKRDNYLKVISTMPSIWQYAKNAGFHSIYIDAQRTGKRLQNGMTEEETYFIDEFIQFDDIPVVSRDLAVATKLVELVNNHTQDFIIINKVGGHFPVHDKYPSRLEVYKPALPKGRFKNISDVGARSILSSEFDNWLLYRNSYRNTLLWGVGNFFEEIFNKSKLNNAVIIYTSDHGQNLHEDGSKGNLTHCSPKPRMVEGMVPLVIIQGEELETLNWSQHLKANKNGASHYNIFPTLLTLMKYNTTEIKQVYGTSLNQLTDDNLTFNTRFFSARFGRKASWKKINPADIIIPTEYRNIDE